MNHVPFALAYSNNRKLGGINSTSEPGFSEKYSEVYKSYSYEKLNDSVFDEQIIEEEVVYDNFKLSNEINNDNGEEEDYDDDDDEDAKFSNESLSIDNHFMDNTTSETIAMDAAVEKIIEARNFTNSDSKFLERYI